MKKLLVIAVLLIGFGVSDMNAQTRYRNEYRPAYHQNQGQKGRITHGVNNGQVNRREFRNLRFQQKNIRQLERMAWADGRVTRGERKMLRNSRNRANRNIFRKKHNCR